MSKPYSLKETHTTGRRILRKLEAQSVKEACEEVDSLKIPWQGVSHLEIIHRKGWPLAWKDRRNQGWLMAPWD